MVAHDIVHWVGVTAVWLGGASVLQRFWPPAAKGVLRLIRGTGEETRVKIAEIKANTDVKITNTDAAVEIHKADITASHNLIRLANDRADASDRRADNASQRADRLAELLDEVREECLQEKLKLTVQLRNEEDKGSAAETTYQHAKAEWAGERKQLTARAESLALELEQLREHMR